MPQLSHQQKLKNKTAHSDDISKYTTHSPSSYFHAKHHKLKRRYVYVDYRIRTEYVTFRLINVF